MKDIKDYAGKEYVVLCHTQNDWDFMRDLCVTSGNLYFDSNSPYFPLNNNFCKLSKEWVKCYWYRIMYIIEFNPLRKYTKDEIEINRLLIHLHNEQEFITLRRSGFWLTGGYEGSHYYQSNTFFYGWQLTEYTKPRLTIENIDYTERDLDIKDYIGYKYVVLCKSQQDWDFMNTICNKPKSSFNSSKPYYNLYMGDDNKPVIGYSKDELSFAYRDKIELYLLKR